MVLADAEAVEAHSIGECDLLHELRHAVAPLLSGWASIRQHLDEAINSNPHDFFSPIPSISIILMSIGIETMQTPAKAPKAAKSQKPVKPAKSKQAKAERNGNAEKSDKVSGTQLWLVMIKAYHSLLAFAENTLKDSGLGESEFRILEVLLHKGPMPVNTIGPKVFLTPGSISVAVDRLLKRGLVTRTNSSEDRRVRVVDLTPSGRRLIEQVFAAHARQVDRLAEVLSPKERRQIARGLKAFGKAAAHVTS
jgi:MarR family 2-MHQ and catechol resistance regulon transcriptional repressor